MTHRFANLLGSLLFFSAAGIQSGMAAPACTVINTAADFDLIRAHPEGSYYCLGRDIDMTGVSFAPMYFFRSAFDGRGHVIRNLTIRSSGGQVGLFGEMLGGEIRNVGLINVQIEGGDETGALVGNIYNGTVRNSYATGSVKGGY